MTNSTIKNKKIIELILVSLFWVGVWQVAYLIVGRDIYIPSPLNVLKTLKNLVILSDFWKSVFFSIYRVIVGMTISFIVGVTLGVISALNRYAHVLISPLITIIKSTPILSFIILALLWFTSSNVVIFICFLMCFPIIWTNTVMGVRNIDKNLLEMTKVYKVKKLYMLKYLYIQGVKPYIITGILTSLGIGWKVTVTAEVLSNPRYAIGSNLYRAKTYLMSEEVFAWTITVIILSMIFEKIFKTTIRKFR